MSRITPLPHGLWSEDIYGPCAPGSATETGQRVDHGEPRRPNFDVTPEQLRGLAAAELVIVYNGNRPKQIETGLTPDRADLHIAYLEANMPDAGRRAILALKKYADLARSREGRAASRDDLVRKAVA